MNMDEYTEIKEKLLKFFEKKQLSDETIYFILKDLQEEMWDNIKNQSDDDDDDYDLDEFEEDDTGSEEEPEEEPKEDLTEEPKVRLNKLETAKTFLKRPKVEIKSKKGETDGLD